jgi:hypothetical protein
MTMCAKKPATNINGIEFIDKIFLKFTIKISFGMNGFQSICKTVLAPESGDPLGTV